MFKAACPVRWEDDDMDGADPKQTKLAFANAERYRFFGETGMEDVPMDQI